jgi:3-oxoacyl-[acyl-carrier-protein] synthase II
VAVNRELGWTGEAVTVGTACSASNSALGYAYDLIRSGEVDIALAGGAESISRFTHAGFHRLGTLAPDRCSPFDRDREGIITAEGGSAVLLEPLDAALRRGARIYAQVLGYALTCDATHMVRPDLDSIVRCMRLAHARAGVQPDEVDYVCAHGTATRTNDEIESHAVREVFGIRPPPTSSVKSMLGHAMGAASGFGAIACAIALHQGFIPPTANFTTPDPAFPWLDPVPNEARPQRLEVVQNNGFGFGGSNAVVILGRAG